VFKNGQAAPVTVIGALSLSTVSHPVERPSRDGGAQPATPASDHRLAEIPRVLAALDAALAAIRVPAFILDTSGEILRSNVGLGGRPAIDLKKAERSLAATVSNRSSHPSSDLSWDLTPLSASGALIGFLAVLRPSPAPLDDEAALSAAQLRWKLTPRQTDVLRLVVRGLTNLSIAEVLVIGRGTVEFHISAIFDKAGVDNRATLIARVRDL
jgi:DNA-binding CsgD family transcriptional regulator